MTSALGGVLSLALVLSTVGTTSEGSADHDISARMTPHIDHRDLYKPFIYPNMKPRTNIHRHSKYDDFINTSELRSSKYIENVYKGNDIGKRNVGGIRKLSGNAKKRIKRETEDKRCEAFQYNDKATKMIKHPHDTKSQNKTYYPKMNCHTVIRAAQGEGITLTFVDIFHIEGHPNCEYDFLEIRDGPYGYGQLLGKFCGEKFPPQVMSTGPALWLKFKSDDTIEYEGFHISIDIQQKSTSHQVPDTCNHTLSGWFGEVDSKAIKPECLAGSIGQSLDVIWTITTPEKTKIYLNFTSYALANPNECEENLVQVFGYVLEFDSKLAHYCGSVANAVMTADSGKDGEEDHGNIMYVRMFASKKAREKTVFSATFTAFRTKTNQDEDCDKLTEFDCQDNTCINKDLRCDGYANCRLKGDEDSETCKGATKSVISEPHIMTILVIFSLILSGMSFVFLFKCIRKLYHDHKIIKEHISQSCEDRLDTLMDSRLALDPKKLQGDRNSIGPRASLERDNHTNEMFKKQRKISQQRKHSSIDSDLIQETQIEFNEEPWTRNVESTPLEAADIKLERNGRTRRHDLSKREDSLRKIRDRKSEEPKERKEIRDVSVGAPDTKESGCQTRESLFQAEVAPSDGSGNSSNSRGFSTFGYSGGTVVRPSPPAQTETTEITIELLRQITPQESVRPQKKISERRPMSTETTRSAPDVIIVSKPIR